MTFNSVIAVISRYSTEFSNLGPTTSKWWKIHQINKIYQKQLNRGPTAAIHSIPSVKQQI